MELQDDFYIYILDDVLKYKVINIKVVLPNDTENIKTVHGQDLVTLVTCTPKYINSHRLLVIGERVEGEEMDKKQSKYTSISSVLIEYNLFIIGVIIIFNVFVVMKKMKIYIQK